MKKPIANPLVPPAFVTLFGQVVRRSQLTGRLEPETLSDYYEILQKFPIEVLAESAQTLAETQKFFPSTAEWFQAATEVAWNARRALLDRPALTSILCGRCGDTGSVYATCPGDSTCGRPRAHASHDFVCVCACRATNLNYQRKLASDPARGSEDER
jgi:hypothetical protein